MFTSDSHSPNFLMDLVLRNLIPERLSFNVVFLPTTLNTELTKYHNEYWQKKKFCNYFQIISSREFWASP